MKNKIIFIVIILLVFIILLIPLKGSYAFYSDSKDLEIINTKVGDWKTLLGYLRMNDKNNNLSSTILGDMYRYQGTDNVANWICFGTTENCGPNDELVDKYMYRIIGITPEGQLKLLKETFVKEGGVKHFSWNANYSIQKGYNYSCPEGRCPEWKESLIFKRLNGLSNGNIEGTGFDYDASMPSGSNTNIFVNSKYYDYLQSNNTWYDKIKNNTKWMYGDIGTYENIYSGYYIYEIENGKASVSHYDGTYWNSEEDNDIHEEIYTWNNSIEAPIGLLYISDYMYAYFSENVDNSQSVFNSWIHYLKDGYNDDTEWLMTRFGYKDENSKYIGAFHVRNGGILDYSLVYVNRGVRPVFYLNSDVKLKEGTTGTKENPFILNVE